jgi:prepilin-type N-terminal cleavage/methylation domain-containing protein
MRRPFLLSTFYFLRSSRASRRAFTLIELVIVIAIIAAASIGTFLLFSGRRNATDLASTKEQIAAVLRQAQSRSVSRYQNVIWGVYFSNSTITAPFYVLFSSSYSTATTAAYYRLPPSVAYVTSTLAQGSTSTITFAGLSGTASAPMSIGLYSKTQQSLASATVSIAADGEVGF